MITYKLAEKLKEAGFLQKGFFSLFKVIFDYRSEDIELREKK